MVVLEADAIAETHRYLAKARPDWRRSMGSIQNEGGPWECATCEGLSLLPWRCSQCGADLAGNRGTQGRQG